MASEKVRYGEGLPVLSRGLKPAVVALMAATFLSCSPEPPDYPEFCMGEMTKIGAALERYRGENGGRYPEQLSELSPYYLWWLPRCGFLGAVPHYTVSPDRRWYGLDCAGNHVDEKKDPRYTSAVAATSRRLPRFAISGDTSRRADTLLEWVQRIEEFHQRHGRRPRDMAEVGLAPDSAGEYRFAIAPTADGAYQVICLEPDYLGVGIAPLQPRYDSRTGRVTEKRLDFLGTPYRWRWSPILVNSLIGLFLCLGMYRLVRTLSVGILKADRSRHY